MTVKKSSLVQPETVKPADVQKAAKPKTSDSDVISEAAGNAGGPVPDTKTTGPAPDSGTASMQNISTEAGPAWPVNPQPEGQEELGNINPVEKLIGSAHEDNTGPGNPVTENGPDNIGQDSGTEYKLPSAPVYGLYDEAEEKFNKAVNSYIAVFGNPPGPEIFTDYIEKLIAEKEAADLKVNKPGATPEAKAAALRSKRERKYGKGYIVAKKDGGQENIFSSRTWAELKGDKNGWREVVPVPDEIKHLK